MFKIFNWFRTKNLLLKELYGYTDSIKILHECNRKLSRKIEIQLDYKKLCVNAWDHNKELKKEIFDLKHEVFKLTNKETL